LPYTFGLQRREKVKRKMGFWKTSGSRVGWYLTLGLVLLLAGYDSARGADTPPAVGTTAPDFRLNSQEGTPVNLHDFRGKWVVLYFYPKDFTSGCTMEAHNFQRDLSQYEQKNSVILGVSVQSSNSHKEFCAKEGLSFKLLADTNHEVSVAYGSVTNLVVTKLAARHTFLINPEGVIVREFLDVNPNKHSQEVLAALTQLQQSAATKPSKQASVR
jgi:peroxiredoxin Q/BCP